MEKSKDAATVGRVFGEPNVNRIVLGGQIIAVVLLLTARAVLKRHLKRR